MTPIKDRKWKVLISSAWLAKSGKIRIWNNGHQIYNREKCKKDWERFAKANKIKNWRYTY